MNNEKLKINKPNAKQMFPGSVVLAIFIILIINISIITYTKPLITDITENLKDASITIIDLNQLIKDANSTIYELGIVLPRVNEIYGIFKNICQIPEYLHYCDT